MLNIPITLAQHYDKVLTDKEVAINNRGHFKKWLRYYLDFCHKYGFEPTDKQSFPPFNDKLQAKNQSDFLRQQASHAISLYYELVAYNISVTGNSIETQISKNKFIRTASDTARLTGRFSQNDSPHSSSPATANSATKANSLQRQSFSTPLTTQSATHSHPVPASNTVDDSDSQGTMSDNNISTGTGLLLKGASWVDVYEGLESAIKVRHYSPKTWKAYRTWVRKLQNFTHSKDPALLSITDVKAFLSHLAVEKNVSAATQNQAFNALLFLFTHVFEKPLGKVEGVVRAKRKPYIPVVLSRQEVDQLFSKIDPPYTLIAQLLYGCGLRLSEGLKLRVQDLDFDQKIVTVHDGKGRKDRALPMPEALLSALQKQLAAVKVLHQADLAAKYDGVFLPSALAKKYPQAAKSLAWQWFFPAKTLTLVPESREIRRYHLHETHIQKAISRAVKKAQIPKRASAHTFRHSFASHLLQANVDIRTIQSLLGHSRVTTTMIYTHTVKSTTYKEAVSPLDIAGD